MARDGFDTVGVMFSTSDGFPTLEEVARTDHANTYGLDIPDEVMAWPAVAWNPNYLTYGDEDQRAMDTTNWDVITGFFDDIPVIRSQMGTESSRYEWHTVGADDALEQGCALIDGSVLVVAPDHDAIADMLECARSLSDYPLLDESAYSELQCEAWQEYAPTALRDEIRDATRDERYPEEELARLEDTADDLLPILGQHLDYSEGWSGDYSPDFLTIYDQLTADGSLVWLDGAWTKRACVDRTHYPAPPECVGRLELSADGKPRCSVHRARVDGLPLAWPEMSAAEPPL